MGLGCHMGGVWVGAAGYADDLILLAPSRTAMQHMLKACDKYAADFNLQFSTDPVPALSKSKCLYMDAVHPSPLQLGDHVLPWVEHATHLSMSFISCVTWNMMPTSSVLSLLKHQFKLVKPLIPIPNTQ